MTWLFGLINKHVCLGHLVQNPQKSCYWFFDLLAKQTCLQTQGVHVWYMQFTYCSVLVSTVNCNQVKFGPFRSTKCQSNKYSHGWMGDIETQMGQQLSWVRIFYLYLKIMDNFYNSDTMFTWSEILASFLLCLSMKPKSWWANELKGLSLLTYLITHWC